MSVINDFVEKNLSLADQLASRKKRSMQYNWIPLDDLKSAAYYGLFDAARKFDASKECTFKVYARIRILGEMNDLIRTQARRAKRISFESLDITERHGQERACLKDFIPDNHREVDLDFFEKIVRCLYPNQRQLVKYHYIDGLTLREIADKLHINESYASLLLKQCRIQLYTYWKDKRDDLLDDLKSKTGDSRNVLYFGMLGNIWSRNPIRTN